MYYKVEKEAQFIGEILHENPNTRIVKQLLCFYENLVVDNKIRFKGISSTGVGLAKAYEVGSKLLSQIS